MATHAQVANDLIAQAAYFDRRDRDIERLCSDAAHLIRRLLAGEAVDGRTITGVVLRLNDRWKKFPADSQISKSMFRGLSTLNELRVREMEK